MSKSDIRHINEMESLIYDIIQWRGRAMIAKYDIYHDDVGWIFINGFKESLYSKFEPSHYPHQFSTGCKNVDFHRPFRIPSIICYSRELKKFDVYIHGVPVPIDTTHHNHG